MEEMEKCLVERIDLDLSEGEHYNQMEGVPGDLINYSGFIEGFIEDVKEGQYPESYTSSKLGEAAPLDAPQWRDFLEPLIKPDAIPSSRRPKGGRPKSKENITRRRKVWDILVKVKGEDVDPSELTPTEVYRILKGEGELENLYEPSHAPSYRQRAPKSWKRFSIKTRIQSDLRYLPPE